jgi:hypothetical protein
MKKVFIILTALFFTGMLGQMVHAQVFVKITDPANPIVSEGATPDNYRGASWVDYDNDGWLDLFVNGNVMFRNLGGGNFFKTTIFATQRRTLANSWADYDNDGDIDCFLTATSDSNSRLWRNEGGGIFTKIMTGTIGDSNYNTGWGCTWGDYNNDGYVDLFIAAASPFGVVNHPNRFYYNNGDGTFTNIDTSIMTSLNAPFTVPSWTDYDKDGDMDMFIGTGPGGSTARDYLYRNMKTETGTAGFIRLDTGIMATSLVDGQNYNFIDYDNDKDVDVFLTNYAGSVPNNLYRNEGSGYYVKMTQAQVGSIVSDPGLSLANTWGDFDNDGDLECIVTRQNNTCMYYNNNGDGTFTRRDSLVISTQLNNFGATIGDYDKDGDLDVYLAGPTSTKALLRNDLNSGNKWINIKLEGSAGATGSNRSAIGAEVRVKCMINGNPVWQYREVSAQNSFNCMNMLNVHFGLGNTSVIDSMVVKWPRGLTQVFTNVAVNNFYNLTEGQTPVVGITQINSKVPESFLLGQNYPNPFNPATSIEFSLPQASEVVLKVFDVSGKEIQTLVNGRLNTGNYKAVWNAAAFPSGAYFYTLSANGISISKKMMLVK